MGLPLDHAVSAFIEDVEARGLDDKILLVVAGEMGRTPRVNKNGGRDHWGNLGPLLLHGGGLKMGQVIGQSTANGGEPATEPATLRRLIATIMHTLLHPGEVPHRPRHARRHRPARRRRRADPRIDGLACRGMWPLAQT